jgi:hypothetical protein
MRSTLIFVLCGLALVVFGLGTVGTLFRSSQGRSAGDELADVEKAKDRGTIQWHVKRAKLKHQDRVVLRAPIAQYQQANDFNDAITSNGVVLAEVVDKRSYLHGNDEIVTWYKFRIVETLSKTIPYCVNCASHSELVPKEMLPLNSDEVLIGRAEGTIEIDGVQIAMIDPDFPEFLTSRRYLLFLQRVPADNLAILRMGPTGAFSVESGDAFFPMGKQRSAVKPDRFNEDMNTRFGESLTRLKTHLEESK